MPHDHAARLNRAAEETAASGVVALLIAPSADLLYLTGYDPPPLERLTALIVRPDGEPVLLVPELERPRALNSPGADRLEIRSWRDGDDPYEAVTRIVSSAGTYGVADRMWASHLLGLQSALPDARFLPASRTLSRLRARKDESEVALLARAARSADEAFRRICREGLEGRAEEDVARSLARHLTESGHDTAAFTIVASGPNGASPHHEPGGRGIRDGDAVVLDFGGRVGGYWSDVSRTVCVGTPTDELREVHEIVREAQQAAFAAVWPGVPAEEVDAAAREVIEDAGYGDAFLHRTGHGIGLEEHEDPYLVAGNAEPLDVGMCFSIEPGIYLEGRFGVRIEDIVTVTPDGGLRLNSADRDLATVM
ncbi:MAG: aminopeptidase P family protein [Actinobacteria bacterium]|nr:aminopeptidase P family protein [Actinomycetota bacterium]